MSVNDDIATLAREIESAASVVAFTGAGISTECGIPDFRSPGSAWKRHPPMPYANFLASEDNRRLAWRRKFEMDEMFGAARPGRGHHALASMMKGGKVTSIITQNIDGLHEAAGCERDNIIELHGNTTYAVCLACGGRHELAPIRMMFAQTGDAPVCECGGLIKSAAISFGQKMPVDALRRAQTAALSCDLFLVIGSTLKVQPAARFPLLAKQNCARLIIINREPTPLDNLADVTLRNDIGDIFAPLITSGL